MVVRAIAVVLALARVMTLALVVAKVAELMAEKRCYSEQL